MQRPAGVDRRGDAASPEHARGRQLRHHPATDRRRDPRDRRDRRLARVPRRLRRTVANRLHAPGRPASRQQRSPSRDALLGPRLDSRARPGPQSQRAGARAR
jgi:hypothetical protein